MLSIMSKRTLFSSIGSFFGDIGRANEAVRTYNRLDAMSDERLASRGLERRSIAAAAFESAFFGRPRG